MNCRRARKILVAWQDGELSPSETAQLEEHLQQCVDCQRRESRLAAATPDLDIVIPARVRLQLASAVDEALRAEARRPAPEPRPSLFERLRRHVPMPMGLSLAYAGLLAVTTGWGVSNWLEARELQAAIASAETVAAQAQPHDKTPDMAQVEAWRPPSYTPSDHWF